GGADRARARAGREIGVGFGVAHRLRVAFHANLQLERLPMEAESGVFRLEQLAPFAALEVRVEDEPALVDGLQEDNSEARTAFRIDGRQRKRSRLGKNLTRKAQGLFVGRLEAGDRVCDGLAHPIARREKLRMPSVQNAVATMSSATTTIGNGMCGTAGVNAPRIPSATYTIGFTSTRYFITGTTSSPRQG